MTLAKITLEGWVREESPKKERPGLLEQRKSMGFVVGYKEEAVKNEVERYFEDFSFGVGNR